MYLIKKLMGLRILLSVSLGLSLTGCANLRDLSLEEFKTQEYYRKTVLFDKGILEINRVYEEDELSRARQEALRFAAQRHYRFKVSPDKSSATVWWEVLGVTKFATMAVIEFQKIPGNPNATRAKIYAANGIWENSAESHFDYLRNFTKENMLKEKERIRKESPFLYLQLFGFEDLKQH